MGIISEDQLISAIEGCKKILLLEPPYPRKYPPLSLAKISSLCKARGIQVDYARQMVYQKYDLILITTLFTYYSNVVKEVLDARGLFHRNTPTIVGGIFASILPKYFDQFNNVDVFTGYSKVLDQCIPDRAIMDTAEEPWNEFSWVFTSRGCANKCFSGDTLVNTVMGDIPIKELVGKNIGVYTYDPSTKKVFITKAIHIRKMGFKKLVRVLFDDGTHIDCTPDQRFLKFLNGNQFIDLREFEVEAKDLKKGDSVRAIRVNKHKQGYNIVSWGRSKRELQHRLVAEYKLGRSLDDKEVVHHKDGIKDNNLPRNLRILSGMKDHYKNHPEISERMRLNNPCVFNTPESHRLRGLKNRGVKRSLKTRLLHRLSKLGHNNPNYKHGLRTNTISRIPEINHRVVSVTPIHGAMTYDLEVPATGWFFANQVLVHNCGYCCVWRIEKERWTNEDWRDHIFPDKPNILICDNNLSAVSYDHMKSVIDYANSKGKAIMFEGGVDVKFITKESAKLLSTATYARHGLRMAFDRIEEDGIFQAAVQKLIDTGMNIESNVEAFLLFNFDDNPRDAYYRGREAYTLGIHQVYPMFYRQLTSLTKDNPFIGKHWTFNLARAFRNYWLQRRWFKYFAFEAYLHLPETVALYNLTEEDFEKWHSPTVPFHQIKKRFLKK